MSDVNRSVELYNGAPIERVTPGPLVLHRNPRFSLVTGVYVGSYGEVGMGIIDRCPGKRSAAYPDTASDSRLSELVHYFGDMNQMFEIMRCIVLPSAVSSFIKQDILMGARLIDRCIMDTVAGDFNEVGAEQSQASAAGGPLRGVNRLVCNAVRIANPTLLNGPSEGLDSGVSSHAYVSSHPLRDQDEVIRLAENSIPVSLGNLDRVIALFGRGVSLPSRYVSFSDNNNQQQLPPPGI